MCPRGRRWVQLNRPLRRSCLAALQPRHLRACRLQQRTQLTHTTCTPHTPKAPTRASLLAPEPEPETCMAPRHDQPRPTRSTSRYCYGGSTACSWLAWPCSAIREGGSPGSEARAAQRTDDQRKPSRTPPPPPAQRRKPWPLVHGRRSRHFCRRGHDEPHYGAERGKLRNLKDGPPRSIDRAQNVKNGGGVWESVKRAP